MKRTLSTTLLAVLTSVGGGIGLSLAHTSGDGLLGLALFTDPAAPESYQSKFSATPAVSLVEPVRVARAAPVPETVMPDISVVDQPVEMGKFPLLKHDGLAPYFAARPKARILGSIASVVDDAPMMFIEAAPVARPLPERAKRYTPPRRQTTPVARSATPRPDFLIGVYR